MSLLFDDTRPDLLSILIIVVAGAAAFLAVRAAARVAVRHLLNREAEQGTAADLAAAELEKRVRTVQSLAVRVIGAVILIVAVLMVLGEFDLDIGPALAGLGVFGLAVGLGTQTLVRDWVGGIIILVENQYGRGDFVELAGVSGTVEYISLRRTVLRSPDGTVHNVPHGEIRVASNQTKLWSGVSLEVRVAAADRLDAVTQAVDAVGREMSADGEWGPLLVEPPRVEGVTGVGDGGIRLLVRGSVRTKAQWKVAAELRRRLVQALGTDGISL
ncbi:MAG: mechanosensitive ion channel family protein [Chloroflexota bacterium]|nr:mechanosensitive ion channel family protein [Chloroflexota bacterium]